ncbi:hypothetical protein M3223_11800 [Paenibacillus pasadenensis]|uniref:phage tail terminator family protein n=1 Tax=Paenibacillus pasadenensis TaxID=217090 RepID=UPI0020424248|nr:hypothetical protein [Paenibacillus pasadenensis]MCM3748036.1 hypothetical protein [Paenibacillus pasadenensis]
MDMIAAIAARLREQFPDCTVLTGEPASGSAPKPFMELRELSGSRQNRLGRRYRRQALFILRYVPAEAPSPAPENAISEMAEGLYSLMASIALPEGGLLKGSGMSYERVDGTLLFKWNAAYDGIEAGGEPPLMRTLQEEVGTDG